MIKSNKKITIFLDTTNLFTSTLSLEINRPVLDFCKFRDNYFTDLKIVIPLTVFNERKFKNLKYFLDNKKEILESSKKIEEEVGLKLDIDKLKEFNANDLIDKKINASLKDKNIEIYDCDIDGKIILERRFLEKKPFDIDESANKRRENGIKDTAIWLSFLDYYTGNTERDIIFVTGNTNDFNKEVQEEFYNKFNKRLLIFSDLSSVEQYLSAKYSVGDKADIDRKIKIESLVKQSVGDILLKLHQKESEQKFYFGMNSKYICFTPENIEEWSVFQDDLVSPIVKVKMIVSAHESNQQEQQNSYSAIGSNFANVLRPLGSFYPNISSYLLPEKKYVEAKVKLNLSDNKVIDVDDIKLDYTSYII